MNVQTSGLILLISLFVADVFICCAGKDILVTQDICDTHNTHSIKANEEIVLNYYRRSEVNVTGVCTLIIEGASNDLIICVHFGHSYMAMIPTYVCSERFKLFYTGHKYEQGMDCYDFNRRPLCTRKGTVKAVYNYNEFGFVDGRLRIRVTANRLVTWIPSPTTTPRTTRTNWSNNNFNNNFNSNYNNNGGYNNYGNEPKKEPKYIFGLKVFGIIIGACIVLVIILYYCQKKVCDSDDNTRSVEEPAQRWSAPTVDVPTGHYYESQPACQPLSTYREDDDDNIAAVTFQAS